MNTISRNAVITFYSLGSLLIFSGVDLETFVLFSIASISLLLLVCFGGRHSSQEFVTTTLRLEWIALLLGGVVIVLALNSFPFYAIIEMVVVAMLPSLIAVVGMLFPTENSNYTEVNL